MNNTRQSLSILWTSQVLMTKTILLATITAIIIGLTAFSVVLDNSADAQGTPLEHETFVLTETIHLDGKLEPGDFRLLIDTTSLRVIDGHFTMKVPCDKNGETSLRVGGWDGTFKGKPAPKLVRELSNFGESCVYSGDIPIIEADSKLALNAYLILNPDNAKGRDGEISGLPKCLLEVCSTVNFDKGSTSKLILVLKVNRVELA